MTRREKREALEGFLFLLPNLLGFLVFFAVPLALSLYYSFTDYNLFNNPSLVGLKNYGAALGFKIDPSAFNAALADGKTWLEAVGRIFLFQILPCQSGKR